MIKTVGRTVLGVCLILAACTAGAVEPERLAPPTALAFVELTQPEAVLDRLLAPAVVEKVTGLDQVRQYLASAQYIQARVVLGLVETRLGTRWSDIIRQGFGKGVQFSFDPATNAGLLVAQAKDPTLLPRLNEMVLEFVKNNGGGGDNAVGSEEYQGVTVWNTASQAWYAYVDDLLVASNRRDALVAAIDRAQDPTLKSLADVVEFQAAQQATAQGSIAWGYLGLAAIKQNPDVAKALSLPHDNPLAELLLGGVLDSAKTAAWLAASLQWEGDQLRLQTVLPRSAEPVAPERAWFFAPDPSAAPLVLPHSIATLSLSRDVAGMWVARDELFVENINTNLAQVDGTLGLFFSGRDFGPEVLGELAPRWHVVVTQQEFPPDAPVPALKLPAFALVVGIKDPKFATSLLMAYQNVIGITNINGAMNGQPQFLLDAEEYRGSKISKASYAVTAEIPAGQAPVNFNFSPSCAQVGNHWVLGSTAGIVRQAIDALSSQAASASPLPDTLFTLDAGELAGSLEINRELIVSQNMLSEGRTRAEAEQRIGLLFDLLRMVTAAEVQLRMEPAAMVLEVSVNTDPALRP